MSRSPSSSPDIAPPRRRARRADGLAVTSHEPAPKAERPPAAPGSSSRFLTRPAPAQASSAGAATAGPRSRKSAAALARSASSSGPARSLFSTIRKSSATENAAFIYGRSAPPAAAAVSAGPGAGNSRTAKEPLERSGSDAGPKFCPVDGFPSFDDIEDFQDEDIDELIMLSSSERQNSLPPPASKPASAPRPSFPSSRMFQTPPSKGAQPRSKLRPEPAKEIEFDENSLWVDRFRPKVVAELAVNKKKVDEVRQWLDTVFNDHGRHRLLILKGPAGSGKSATLSLLAEELGLQATDWKMPTANTAHGYVSVIRQLEDFLMSSARYGSLDFGSEEGGAGPAGKEMVVMEEFPTANQLIQPFRKTVTAFVESTTPTLSDIYNNTARARARPTPLVMVITESGLSTGSGSASDSFTAYRLLGPDLLSHPSTTVIEFNPIAPTFMKKALESVLVRYRILQRQLGMAGKARPYISPPDSVILDLSQMGDIRSAIGSLQFLLTPPKSGAASLPSGRSAGTTTSSSRTTGKRKRGKEGAEKYSPKHPAQLFSGTSLRQTPLGIFHAVGKVVYNSRIDAPAPARGPDGAAILPRQHGSSMRIPQNDPDDLLADLGTDTAVFVAALQENYLLSCSPAEAELDPESVTECMASAADALSLADLLSPDGFFGGGGGGGEAGAGAPARRAISGVDELRQAELSFQAAVRGLYAHLPTPVKRVPPPADISATIQTARGASGALSSASVPAHPPSSSAASSFPSAARGPARDAFKIFYPTSLRTWRFTEEADQLVGAILDRATRGTFLPRLLQAAPAPSSGAGPAAVLRPSFRLPAKPASAPSPADDAEPAAGFLTRPSRRSVVAETAPYASLIRAADLFRCAAAPAGGAGGGGTGWDARRDRMSAYLVRVAGTGGGSAGRPDWVVPGRAVLAVPAPPARAGWDDACPGWAAGERAGGIGGSGLLALVGEGGEGGSGGGLGVGEGEGEESWVLSDDDIED